MPTQQPDYGWTVPVSSDMLNGGAVAIQTMADDIAATLLAIEAAVNANTAAMDAKADLASFRQYSASLVPATWTDVAEGTTWTTIGSPQSFSVSPPGYVYWVGSVDMRTYKDPDAYGNPKCYVDLAGPIDSKRTGTAAQVGRQTDNDVLATVPLWAVARITDTGTVTATARACHHIAGGRGGQIQDLQGWAMVTPR